MPGRIRIISDGTAMGTRVLNADGAAIPGVMRVEILPIEPSGAVTARLTLGLVELELEAELAAGESDGQAEDASA